MPSADLIGTLACQTRKRVAVPNAGRGSMRDRRFVTAASPANLAAAAVARHALLRRLGWNMEAKGLFGAPDCA